MEVNAEIERLRRHDFEALSAFIIRYQRRLFRYLVRMVNDPNVADDLFQQTWVRVMERIRQYDQDRSFESWLFSIAHNLAIDHLRRRQPQSLEESDPVEPLICPDPSALTQLLSLERSEVLAGAFSHLPALYREVLVLRFEEEMKLEEIADLLGTPLSTVKSRLSRGLERLRKQFEESYPEKTKP
jgi:RNA polymerase sigma-70 factor (ECF subfamily)